MEQQHSRNPANYRGRSSRLPRAEREEQLQMSPIVRPPGGFGLPLSAFVLLVAACTGSIPGGSMPRPSGGPGAPQTPPSASAVPAGLRRLTRAQYQNTVRDLLGPSIKLPGELDRDDPEAVFSSVGGYRITTSPAGVLKYEDAAYAIARQVFADPALVQSVVGCDPRLAACAASFMRGVGRRAWRRPLTDAEVARYLKLIDSVAKLMGTPESGFEYALAGLLQSPNFMYLPEVGESDRGRTRFTSHEMASRLSYLLTDAPPDAELAAAADRNELVAPSGLRAQFDRLLASPRAKPALVGFFGQLLDLTQLDDLTKDPDVYPKASPALFAAMRAEAERLIDETAFAQRGALLSLYDLKTAFVNADLAKLYGLAPPTTGTQAVPLPGTSERGGILTTAAWLSIQAKPYSSSPTLRGVWVRERMLCQEVPPPPANVNNVLPNPSERAAAGAPRTTRQVLEDHRRNPECASCHELFDSVGVAFERFDGIGAYRTEEGKLPIDTHGTLDGRQYATVSELIALLKADARVSDCLVRQLYRSITGHERLPGEDEVVRGLAPEFRARPDFRDLLTRMVAADWFRSPGAPL
jgi:Protein of unknown function (DUF1592)/Protein of unknown function (DUF1588)/Protein of unknown function (DUF1595)/Protein of unknown function (DUF1587)